MADGRVRMPEQAGEYEEWLEEHVWGALSEKDARMVVNTILTLCTNIIDSPANPAFHVLRLSNARLSRTLLAPLDTVTPGLGRTVLALIGYTAHLPPPPPPPPSPPPSPSPPPPPSPPQQPPPPSPPPDAYVHFGEIGRPTYALTARAVRAALWWTVARRKVRSKRDVLGGTCAAWVRFGCAGRTAWRGVPSASGPRCARGLHSFVLVRPQLGSPVGALPVEIWAHVLAFLTRRELVPVLLSCKLLANVALSSRPHGPACAYCDRHGPLPGDDALVQVACTIDHVSYFHPRCLDTYVAGHLARTAHDPDGGRQPTQTTLAVPPVACVRAERNVYGVMRCALAMVGPIARPSGPVVAEHKLTAAFDALAARVWADVIGE